MISWGIAKLFVNIEPFFNFLCKLDISDSVSKLKDFFTNILTQ